MKEDTYRELLQCGGKFISGERISANTGVSRAAVSKHIALFREDGAVIESKNMMGHKLTAGADRLKSEYVSPYIAFNADIIWFDEVGSTNDKAKELAVKGAGEWTVVAAEAQTAGRGRRGRSWSSPKHEAVYASVVLRPRAADIQGVTVLMAVAVSRVLRGLGLDARIKWPNDVLVSGSKICGILTEGVFGMDGVDFLVCGAGINVKQKAFDGIGGKSAVSLEMLGAHVSRPELLARVLNELHSLYVEFEQKGVGVILDEYSRLSAHMGKRVTLSWPGREVSGVCAGFAPDGGILIETGEGRQKFIAGEITLREDGR